MDIIKSAQEKLKRDQSAWSEIYEKASDDLHFLSDDKFAQWDQKDYESRTSTGRPAITIDQLGQFIHQVANDIRMNTPTINIIPGDGADPKTAEIFKGMIRNIEYQSMADDAYDTAALNAIKCSVGFIRVDHDYYDDESFDQILCIKRVVNPLSCWIDSESIESDGRDARHGTIIDKIPVSQFKAEYPGKSPVSFLDDKGTALKDDDHIAIAEFFILEDEEKEIGIDDGGNVFQLKKGSPAVRSRKVMKSRVKHYKLSGADTLEETYFPGRYVPLVPVYGEEAWVDGKRQVHSLIRKSKQAQQMYNYWKSLETELLMKQPQAPVLAAAGSIENYMADWIEPNKSMALRYDHVDAQGNQIPKPERLAPPTIPTGIINAAREAVDDIKATMGIYNASLGAKSNETSGVAINQRKMEGDVATFHFGDNLVRSITQVGRILVHAIPEVYDTPRIVRIIGLEDEPKQVGINGMTVEGQEQPFDLTQGKYDVRVITGASYTTRRQEAAAVLSDLFKGSPELLQVMGDLYFENSDFTGAQAMAERMKKAIDPKFLEESNDDPEKMQLQQALQQAQGVIQELQGQMESKQAETQVKAQDNQLKAQIEAAKLQLEERRLEMETNLKAAEIQLKTKELELKQLEMALKAEGQRVEQETRQAEIAMPEQIESPSQYA